ncbi:hypothetical protein M9H77_24691 [Catharanthus roseus]|uniref:Uncharacterized protein n=1 Tax=Catharanthus roseus TaxID=4058 RepID=A0ACC0A900_CATRO|nr:hypothetical protein M9H77_24691 [Catharanthus roseus]
MSICFHFCVGLYLLNHGILEKQLDLISNRSTLWTCFGLRSLAKTRNVVGNYPQTGYFWEEKTVAAEAVIVVEAMELRIMKVPKSVPNDGVEGVPKAGIEDGVPKAGVEEGVPKAGAEGRHGGRHSEGGRGRLSSEY